METEQAFFPKVSIIIPVYNGSNYLAEAIDSALEQTYSNIEIIVVNDGSQDDGKTEEIAVSYGEKIRYFRKENGGVSSALNYGIRQMTGEYFSWLSHDDKYEEHKVANSVGCLSMQKDRERMIALCGAYYINADSEKIRDVTYQFEKDIVHTGDDVIYRMLKHGTINGCCMLIPKLAFSECGFFDENLRYSQDALMWYQIFANGYSLVADPEQRDVMYRIHKEQASKTRRDLLLHDSYEMAKIIAPVLAEKSTKECPVLRMYAKRNALQHCADAVMICIQVGKKEEVFTLFDEAYLSIWLWIGKIRNLVKKGYVKMRLK